MVSQAMPTTRPVRTVDAVFEPLTVADLKRQLQLPASYTGDDQYLADDLRAAREKFESDCGVSCCSSTWRYRLDMFPCVGIEIPLRPVSAISSITYVDTAGATQTWSSTNYTLDADRVFPIIWYAYGVTFPSVRSDWNAVTVTMTAGHASAAAVPQMWKKAMLYLASHYYYLRNPVITGTIVAEVPHTYEALISGIKRSSYP